MFKTHISKFHLKLFMATFLWYHLIIPCLCNLSMRKIRCLLVPKFTHRLHWHKRQLLSGWQLLQTRTGVSQALQWECKSGWALPTFPSGLVLESCHPSGLGLSPSSHRWPERRGSCPYHPPGVCTPYSTHHSWNRLLARHVRSPQCCWMSSKRSLKLTGSWLRGLSKGPSSI
jgi:hypothetical protein